MASSLEMFRRNTLRKGDLLDWHPMNQRMVKDIRGRQEKGRNPNAEKSEIRKERNRLERRENQFQRSLAHMLGGYDDMDTSEATKATEYALTNVDNYEKVINAYRTGKETIVTIAFVDLSHINGVDKETAIEVSNTKAA